MGTEESNQTEILNDYNNKEIVKNKLMNLTIKNTNQNAVLTTKIQNFNGKELIQNSDDDVPNIPITIDEKNVIDGAKEILKVIRNDWKLNNIEFKFFTDGLTNKLVGCFHNNSKVPNSSSSSSSSSSSEDDKINLHQNGRHSDQQSTNSKINGKTIDYNSSNVILIRVHGNNTELLIDRKAEQRNIRLLHTYGFAPSLFATFNNGLAYEYVPGCTLTSASIIQPKIWTLIAQRMAEMHKVKLPTHIQENNEPMLLKKTRSMLNLIPEKFTDPNKHERIMKVFSSISKLRQEFEDLFKILENLNSPLVFAHNDLLLGNIIYTENLQRVTFIDYEYAALNFQGFDIGNHFAEFAGIEIEEIDYSLYPSKEFQMKWLYVYLKSYLDLDDDNDVPYEAVERLYIQSNQFALAAHLFWAIWALVQAEISTIDFDYVKYSQIRYEEYLNKKDQFLRLKSRI